MNKKLLVVMGIILIILAGVILALRVFTPEDTWICSAGTWVSHGSPTAIRPITDCR